MDVVSEAVMLQVPVAATRQVICVVTAQETEQTPVEVAAIVSCVVSAAAVAHTPEDTAASGSNSTADVEQIPRTLRSS